jgi:hypothetical protein
MNWSLKSYGAYEMNIDVVKKYLHGITNVETVESARGDSSVFMFGSEAPNGKAYSTKIEVTNNDDVSIQCGLALDHAADIGRVERYASMLNTEFQQKGWGVTFLVEDGCLIASTGTSGEIFSQREISERLMKLLTCISKFDDGLDGETV